MAEHYDEITESNQPSIDVQLEHLLIDLHDVLKILRDQGKILAKHDALLEEFRPLLDQFRSPAASYMARRQQRRNGAGKNPPQGLQIPSDAWWPGIGQGHVKVQGAETSEPTARD